MRTKIPRSAPLGVFVGRSLVAPLAPACGGTGRLNRLDQAMRKLLCTVAVSVGLAGLLLVGAPLVASAAAPERETITFSETWQDEFLTEACGVDVTSTANGRITMLTFPDRPVGPQDLTSIHVDFLSTAGNNSVRVKNVGIDLVRVEPDGTVILMGTGQSPFGFAGVFKVNLTTGEVIMEPQHTIDTTRACHLLTR